MFHFTALHNSSIRIPAAGFRQINIPPSIALPFLAGLAAGSVVGLFSDAPQGWFSSFGLLTVLENSGSFFRIFWFSCRFCIVSAILATGILGILLIPLLSALRGFAFACSVAFAIRPGSFSSLSLAFLSLGLPALISLPAFFSAATDSFYFSCSWLSRDRSVMIHEIPFIRHFLIILLLCSADAVYMEFLLPLLRTLIPK